MGRWAVGFVSFVMITGSCIRQDTEQMFSTMLPEIKSQYFLAKNAQSNERGPESLWMSKSIT